MYVYMMKITAMIELNGTSKSNQQLKIVLLLIVRFLFKTSSVRIVPKYITLILFFLTSFELLGFLKAFEKKTNKQTNTFLL